MRRFRNVPQQQQKALRSQFSWLGRVHDTQAAPGVQRLSISVFDHWLLEDEALHLLDHVGPEEQQARDNKHANAIRLLTDQFAGLDFVFRGRLKQQPCFREALLPVEFRSNFSQPRFRFAFTQLGAIYYEGYDDTWHLYFTSRDSVEPVCVAAKAAGLFVLD
ncbi:MAG: hypothetical protein PHP85_05870 [Gallionella sp.]|nr:hypothetical protein [Gallionella sp.]